MSNLFDALHFNAQDNIPIDPSPKNGPPKLMFIYYCKIYF